MVLAMNTGVWVLAWNTMITVPTEYHSISLLKTMYYPLSINMHVHHWALLIYLEIVLSTLECPQKHGGFDVILTSQYSYFYGIFHWHRLKTTWAQVSTPSWNLERKYKELCRVYSGFVWLYFCKIQEAGTTYSTLLHQSNCTWEKQLWLWKKHDEFLYKAH